jgi:hypothetical protein
VVEAIKAWAASDADAALKALAPLAGETPALGGGGTGAGARTGGLGDVALMMQAEMRVWQADTTEAVRLYDEVAKGFAESPAAPRAAFTAAMIVGKGDKAAARGRLQALIEKYPDATESEEAKLVLQAWEKQTAAPK